MKKLTAIILTLVMALTLALQPTNGVADAAFNGITIQSYCKQIAEKIELASATSSETDCINILKDNGIINENDFTDYSAALTCGDALALLSRADDYHNKTKVSSSKVTTVIKKRISDIKKVTELKQEDVARGFMKGFMIGDSNGLYSSNRRLNVGSKITEKDAKTGLKRLTDKVSRAKLSPDGQVLRTKKLPNNAKMFPYILASYPNRYYEAKLRFEGVTCRVNGKIVPLKSPEDYTYPVNVSKASTSGIPVFNRAKENYLDSWMDKVYTRVWNTFNVNYKTIDKRWKRTIAKTDSAYLENRDYLYEFLNQYVKEMKVNKTIVKCDKLALDGSSMYFYDGYYYIRCYVHYCIKSTKTKRKYSAEELGSKIWGPYNCVLFSRSSFIDLENYKKNKWIEGIFDIGISASISGDDGALYGVTDCDWSPSMFRILKRK